MLAIVVGRSSLYEDFGRELCTLHEVPRRYYTRGEAGEVMVVDPSRAASRWSLPLLKVMPGQKFEVVLGGTRWWFFGSHWLERQFLCVGVDCEGCVYGAPRVMGYRVALLDGGGKLRPVLLEAPLPSVSRFESLAAMEALCFERGARCELTRKHRRAGVTLEAAVPLPDPCAERLTDQQTVGAVAVLFNLPTIEEGEPPMTWAERVRLVAHARLVAAIANQK